MDWLVKVGGSLFPGDAAELCRALVGTSALVVCGGGILANTLRSYDSEFHFSDTANHKSAIMCMEDLNQPLILREGGTAITGSSINNSFRELGKKAGFKHEFGSYRYWRSHSLRKYFISTIMG